MRCCGCCRGSTRRVNLEFNAHFLDTALASDLVLLECPITFHPRVGLSQGRQHQQLARLHGRDADDPRAGVRLAKAGGVSDGGYHNSRLTKDPKRDTVWGALWRYFFSKRVKPGRLRARPRLRLWRVHQPGDGAAADRDRPVGRHAGPCRRPASRRSSGRSPICRRSTTARSITPFRAICSSISPRTSWPRLLRQLKAKLAPGGTLTTLQPNYRYCANEYFDDYTHVTVWCAHQPGRLPRGQWL